MADVIIRIRDNGPLLVEGPVQLIDVEGNVIAVDPAKPAISLCRCGQSNKKPFCDGAHKACLFQSVVRAVKPE